MHLTAFPTGATALETTLAVDDTTAWNDYFGDSVGHANTLSSNLSAADKWLMIDSAIADTQFLIDLIAAQRDFQVAEALEDPAAEADKQTALAQAKYELKKSYADANLDWKQTVAPAIASLVDSQAGSMKGLGDDLAANAVVFENGAIADEVGFFDTNAGAEADYSSDWATAESGFDTSSADIYSTFWKAENDDRVTALAGFATEMGTPWAQFKADLAVAHRDWWVGQEQAYLDWHDDTATEIDTYQVSAGRPGPRAAVRLARRRRLLLQPLPLPARRRWVV